MSEHHDHEVRLAAGSARKNKIANIATAAFKLVCGFVARDPVLASEGGHDFGDAWVHNDHIKEIKSPSKAEGRKFARRSAIKLGGFSLAGAGVELAIENNLDFSPNHLLAFSVASLSLILNRHLKRDAHKHTIDSAHSLRRHTSWDLLVTEVTLANAALVLGSVNVNPLIPIAAHVGIGCAAAWDIHNHAPDETDDTPLSVEE